MDELKRLFQDRFNTPVESIEDIQGELGASRRKIVRLANNTCSAVGIYCDVPDENAAFIEFSRHFHKHGLPVPEIYADDLNCNVYLVEDLGNMTLYQFLQENRAGEKISPVVIEAYRKVIAMLPRFQIEAGRDLNYEMCYPRKSFDQQSISWDLNYFKYYFLKLVHVPFNEQAIEDDFKSLTDFLVQAECEYFLYRDFQSRNVMIRNGSPFFLDYQGGRKGALQYDIASLLYDAKADLSPVIREEFLETYLSELESFIKVDRQAFMHHYYAYVYVRIMQALGAYGYWGFIAGKSFFLDSVPFALGNLRWLLSNVELPLKLPALTEAWRKTIDSDRLQRIGLLGEGVPETLSARVYSFSFDCDSSVVEIAGDGVFVFDVRSLPDPGLNEQYQKLTGKDLPIIEYFLEQEAVHQYLNGVKLLLEANIRGAWRTRYKTLSVFFGCSGGQHRSVFVAEELGKYLDSIEGIEISIEHCTLERVHK